ncbi:hypothetical protein [Bulleidia sp. HCP3S3_F2]|uniref:hypothetical protein n=1 Tax=unclassified Bulleidia TaxID=2704656 RepID=UPI002A88144B|nr:hypothetical protein [Erysipelotrichaceae bacterium]MDD7057479.1 hypothetical protein [Erysipelotrichaceae bacterium]MDY3661044.1 hypothetical protein [Bulleidia sp.]
MLKNDGFFMNDALISVLITSLISVIVYSCIVVHVKIQEKLQEESQIMQDDFDRFFQEIDLCETIEEPY